jgi:hypothetical protein
MAMASGSGQFLENLMTDKGSETMILKLMIYFVFIML